MRILGAILLGLLTILAITCFIALMVNLAEQNRDIDYLADNIYFEARNSTAEDKIAVAVSTINRVKSDQYPNTMRDVIFQPNQFSWTLEYLTPAQNNEWHKCRAIAEMVYKNHSRFQNKDVCLHYTSRLDYPDNHWTHRMKRKTKIGKHWYFCN